MGPAALCCPEPTWITYCVILRVWARKSDVNSSTCDLCWLWGRQGCSAHAAVWVCVVRAHVCSRTGGCLHVCVCVQADSLGFMYLVHVCVWVAVSGLAAVCVGLCMPPIRLPLSRC